MVSTLARPLHCLSLVNFSTSRRVRRSHAGAGTHALRATSPEVGVSSAGNSQTWRAFRPTAFDSCHSPHLISMHASLGSRAGIIATTVTRNESIMRGGAVLPLGTALVATACLASVYERRSKVGGVIGAPLLCFGSFCILSNLHLAPATHALYDLCWSFLLPLSLSIIVLGNPVVAKGRSDSPLIHESAVESRGSRYGPMTRIGVAFTIGAVGSLVGVATAFRVATSSGGGVLALPRESAAQIAGAVAATYIGGSVNLFAVAATVGLLGATSAGGASLLGALAASDIFLMALYFSGLVAAHRAPCLHRFFPRAKCEYRFSEAQEVAENVEGRTMNAPPGYEKVNTRLYSATITLGMFTLSSIICVAGKALSGLSPIPGASTMAVTLLTLAMARVVSRLSPGLHASLSRTAPTVAAVLLNVFFASVGASGRWTQVVGVAPAVFAFASLALGVHVGVLAMGTAALNLWCEAGVGIDDMIVASNANIGGPSTAATFAGLIGQDALVVPAAMWGTLGYAVATTLGVGIWTFLR